MNDKDYMALALENARKGRGQTSPNPLVGAVIVKDGKIIAQGHHEYYGGLHAERNALKNCTEDPAGATMYVNLEPCCHYGKTPPCTEAIIENKIGRVVIGALDSNELVAGQGVTFLQAHGIEVEVGVLQEQCHKLNEVFYHYIATKRPFVIMKYAMTADGKIASQTGDSKWITNELSRHQVHRDRSRYQAIMVGVNTVIKDDCELTSRIEGSCNPIRIICDTNLRTPLTSQVVTTAKQVPTYIATCVVENSLKLPYQQAGCRIIEVPKQDGHVDLQALMSILGRQGIDSIYLEGGAILNYAALQARIVTKIQTYIGMKMIGGKAALTPVGGEGIKMMNDAIRLKNADIRQFDGDILIESEVEYRCLPE